MILLFPGRDCVFMASSFFGIPCRNTQRQYLASFNSLSSRDTDFTKVLSKFICRHPLLSYTLSHFLHQYYLWHSNINSFACLLSPQTRILVSQRCRALPSLFSFLPFFLFCTRNWTHYLMLTGQGCAAELYSLPLLFLLFFTFFFLILHLSLSSSFILSACFCPSLCLRVSLCLSLSVILPLSCTQQSLLVR